MLWVWNVVAFMSALWPHYGPCMEGTAHMPSMNVVPITALSGFAVFVVQKMCLHQCASLVDILEELRNSLTVMHWLVCESSMKGCWLQRFNVFTIPAKGMISLGCVCVCSLVVCVRVGPGLWVGLCVCMCVKTEGRDIFRSVLCLLFCVTGWWAQQCISCLVSVLACLLSVWLSRISPAVFISAPLVWEREEGPPSKCICLPQTQSSHELRNLTSYCHNTQKHQQLLSLESSLVD